MVREIVIWPDPVLKQVASPADRVDDTIRRLLDDMAETMYAADGVGLAAPQVGVGRRVIVIDVSPREPGQKLIHLVNPEIVEAEGKTIYTEGCLSIPGEAEDVERANKVRVRALDYHGKPFEIVAEGDLLAIALQHEIDHLQGTLFVDHLSSLKRELIRKRMKKLKQQRAEEANEAVKGAAKHESAL
jgi:peptide deformylase